jgi:hypothetical protein
MKMEKPEVVRHAPGDAVDTAAGGEGTLPVWRGRY